MNKVSSNYGPDTPSHPSSGTYAIEVGGEQIDFIVSDNLGIAALALTADRAAQLGRELLQASIQLEHPDRP